MGGFGRSIVSVMSRYTDYAGRSSRAEFLWWHLFLMIPMSLIAIVMPDEPTIRLSYGILGLIVGFPTLALGTRRLHDTGRTGWWQLLLLVPAGFIVLFVMCCLKGQPGPNAYGNEPTTG
jgi:uncharacterized membrane protein YhaH (DUF805 family)